MARILLSLPLVMFALPALAGNWGENWGTMIWGSVAVVPGLGWAGRVVSESYLGRLSAVGCHC